MLMLVGKSLTTRSLDPATSAWIAAVGTVSGPRQTLVNNLIVGLKGDGVWTKLDRLWLFAMENATEATTDLVALQTVSLVSAPTFTIDSGYTGSPGYINTNFNPFSGGVNYVQDSASILVWSVSSAETTGSIFGRPSNQSCVCYPAYTDNNLYWRINQSVDSSVTSTDASGLWHATRTGAAVNVMYRNGSSFNSDTVASSALPDEAITFLVTGGDIYPGTVACGAFGSGFNATEASNIYTRLRIYMTAIGVP